MLALSSLCDAVRIVPTPANPFTESPGGLVCSKVWKPNGTWEYAPAGEWVIQNAMVDRENKVGPWSDGLTIDMPLGWLLIGCNYNFPKVQEKDANGNLVFVQGVPSMIPHPDRAAVIWRATRALTNETIWLVEGQHSDSGSMGSVLDPFNTKIPYPFSSNNLSPYPLITHTISNAGLPMQDSTILAGTGTPPEPMAWVCRHSLDAGEVAWSWATHSGETGLSPVLNLGSPEPTSFGFRRLLIGLEEIPEGVLGRYIYKEIEGQWKRQPTAPWLTETDGPDKYLFGVHDNQPILWDEHDGPIHQPPTGQAWSISSPRQQAAYSDEAAILIDCDPYIYGPCIEPYKPLIKKRSYYAHGNSGLTLRQVSNVPAVGDNCPANDHPTYWPMLVIQNSEPQGTTFQSMFFQDDRSRGPGASMCCTASDYSGGQAFKTRFFDCIFFLPPTPFPFTKTGLHIGWECAATAGGHTASEWLFERCAFYNMRIQGTQTVNFLFIVTHMMGYPCGSIEIDGATVLFRGLYVARAETLFSLGWIAAVRVDDFFCDKPGQSLVDFNSYQPRKISINAGDTAGWHFISRSPCSITKQNLLLRNWVNYRPTLGVEQSLAYHCSYDRMKLDMSDSELLAPYVSVIQPTSAEFVQRVPSAVVPVTP